MSLPKEIEFEFALKYIIDKKEGNLSELEIKVGISTAYCLLLTEMVNNECGSKTWKVTNQAKNIYKSFYERPNFIERLKGYYCHYILKF